MGRRGRKRSRAEKAGGSGAAVPASEYVVGDGSLLTLRDSLSDGSLRELGRLEARPAASAEDRHQRRVELLFERLALRWEIAGLPLEGQRELLGRFRLASAEERGAVARVLADHLRERHPDVTL